MKMFVPAVGYRIRLTEDWTFTLYWEDRNETLVKALIPDPNDAKNWDSFRLGTRFAVAQACKVVSLPKDTLLEVDRVYVRTANKAAQDDKDYDSMTFKVLAHPTLDAKKKLRFWAKLTDVNNIEYELPPDYTAGKDEAKARSLKPKKLTTSSIREVLMSALYDIHGSRYHPRQPWATDAAIERLTTVGLEIYRLIYPYEVEAAKECAANDLAESKRKFAAGQIYVELALADKIKTFEDLIKFLPHYGPRDYLNGRQLTWNSLLQTYVLYPAHIQNKVRATKLPDGTHLRVFRGAPKEVNTHPWRKDSPPSVNHVWMKVVTDPTDTSIVSVDGGFDPLPIAENTSGS